MLNQVNCLEVEIRSRITITAQRKLALLLVAFEPNGISVISVAHPLLENIAPVMGVIFISLMIVFAFYTEHFLTIAQNK